MKLSTLALPLAALPPTAFALTFKYTANSVEKSVTVGPWLCGTFNGRKADAANFWLTVNTGGPYRVDLFESSDCTGAVVQSYREPADASNPYLDFDPPVASFNYGA
ncbi:hypothetical protein BJX62DRAFT_237907 [Aspergillus germanicus]